MRRSSTHDQRSRWTRTRLAPHSPAACVLAVATALAISSCGARSSPPDATPPATVRIDAASVCATAQAAIDAVSNGPQTLPDVMRRLAPRISREATQLRAVPIAAGVQAAFDTAVRTATHHRDPRVLTEVAVTGCMAARQGRGQPGVGP